MLVSSAVAPLRITNRFSGCPMASKLDRRPSTMDITASKTATDKAMLKPVRMEVVRRTTRFRRL